MSRALLDTHAFLWWNMGDPHLGKQAKAFIANPENEIMVSVVTGWEIVIKASRGNLSLPTEADQYVTSRISSQGFAVLPIEMRHALQVLHLPLHHKDPFDRLLVAQAQLEGVPLISRDAEIRQYPVETLW